MKKMFATALLAVGLAVPAHASDANVLGEAEVEAIVARWVQENPEKILEAVNAHFAAEEEAKAAEQAARAAAVAPQVVDAGDHPVVGAEEGKTLVYFFDYQCGYCKAMHPILKDLLGSRDDIRIIMREFPILGPVSTEAARIALAVHVMAPEKYEAVHNAFYEHEGRLSTEAIDVILAEAGLDAAAVRASDKGAEIDALIAENKALAADLGITGTPFFFSGTKSIPGATTKDALADLVDTAQAGE